MSFTRSASPRVHSYNEWDPLEEVIVGDVRGAMYPEHSPILAANGDPAWLWYYQGELVEEAFVEAAEAQLEVFIETLEAEGVRVQRPAPMPHNTGFSTPYWQARCGWNSANPRDLFLVVGDEIIECASPLRHRHFESLAYRGLMNAYFADGARLSAAPRPALREPLYDHSFLEAVEASSDATRRRTLDAGEAHRYPITEHEPVFEAADFVRCGRDLFVTRSIVTNASGIAWVRRHLGPTYRVHEIETRCASPWHIDTTFMPLAPGKALVNPRWVRALPACLDGWQILRAPEPEYADDSPMAHPFFTSQWLSMNVLSLDARRLFVDAQQTALLRLLEANGFEPIPLDFDQVGRFGGSFHCVTLDVRRRGTLESYCAA